MYVVTNQVTINMTIQQIEKFFELSFLLYLTNKNHNFSV